jgi:RNA recognition motif-containing protein
MNIYVGNLSWDAKREDLEELFSHFGEVTRAFIVRDKKTRKSRGFGFVELADEKAAKDAIEKLNNTMFMDRVLVVNEAKPKND